VRRLGFVPYGIEGVGVDGIKSEFLFKMEGQLDMPFIPVGATPQGIRIIANLAGGTFEGPKLKGKIARSGGDWGLTRSDGSFKLDVRCCLIADDGTPIYMSYLGLISMNQDLMAVLSDPAKAEALTPSDYYFRSAPFFEVASDSPHEWLNRTIAIGVGSISGKGISYEVYQVL
jgi:hypothetical protein